MKINKTMGALALGLGLAVGAQAQPDSGYTGIYITGSTAFRGQIFQALNVDLGLTTHVVNTSGANSFTIEGTEAASGSLTTYLTGLGASLNESGQKVEVFCNFSGSAEGCAALLGISPYNTATYNNSTGGTTFSHTGVDFAFSDVAQNSTPFATTAGYATLTEDQSPYDSPYAPFTGVAVVPFTFAANASGIAAGISNFTTGDFQALFMASPGYIDQAWFNSTITPGTTPSVVAVGRYNLSGTRITAVLDNGASLLDPLYQWGLANLPPLGAGTNANVGVDYVAGLHQGDGNAPSGTTWVALTGDGFSTGYGPGGDGYFTGGNVGVALAAGSTTPAIAYIAFSDAQSKFKTSGALPIRWNGEVPYIGTYGSGNWNIAGLDNGDYQFWSYERLYENSADLGTKSAPSFMDKWGQDLIYGLQNEIITAVPQTAELEANMNVYRNADGGTVYPEVTPAAPN